MTDTRWLVQTGDSDVIFGLLYVFLAQVRLLARSCGTFNAEMKSRAVLDLNDLNKNCVVYFMVRVQYLCLYLLFVFIYLLFCRSRVCTGRFILKCEHVAIVLSDFLARSICFLAAWRGWCPRCMRFFFFTQGYVLNWKLSHISWRSKHMKKSQSDKWRDSDAICLFSLISLSRINSSNSKTLSFTAVVLSGRRWESSTKCVCTFASALWSWQQK